jgi:ribonuclease HI
MAERFRAAFDGGSRGNPGAAAWGVAVLDDAGDVVEERFGTVGHATNNVAEYHGLIEALKIAAERGAGTVELQADSELIVRQMTGRYRVRHPDLIPLWREASQLAAGFRTFSIRHVPRAQNRHADRLVNRALDLATAGS